VPRGIFLLFVMRSDSGFEFIQTITEDFLILKRKWKILVKIMRKTKCMFFNDYSFQKKTTYLQ